MKQTIATYVLAYPSYACVYIAVSNLLLMYTTHVRNEQLSCHTYLSILGLSVIHIITDERLYISPTDHRSIYKRFRLDNYYSISCDTYSSPCLLWKSTRIVSQ